MGARVSRRLYRPPSPSPQAPSEYETSPDQLFYRIAHLNRGQQYMLWVAAVTSAGRGNISEKVTIEPAGKGIVGAAGLQWGCTPWLCCPLSLGLLRLLPISLQQGTAGVTRAPGQRRDSMGSLSSHYLLGGGSAHGARLLG